MQTYPSYNLKESLSPEEDTNVPCHFIWRYIYIYPSKEETMLFYVTGYVIIASVYKLFLPLFIPYSLSVS